MTVDQIKGAPLLRAAAGMVAALGTVAAFAALPPDLLAALAALCRMETLGAGDLVVRQGAAMTDLHVLLSGTAVLMAGNAEIAQRHGPEATFLMPEALTGAPAPVSVRAVGEAKVLALPLSALRSRLGAGAELALALLAGQAARERQLTDTVVRLQALSLTPRLAAYLLVEHAARKAGGRLDLDMGRAAIDLGTTPADLAWSFGDLKRHGVTLEGTVAVLRDFDALRALATPGPVRRQQAEEWPVLMWDVDEAPVT
ncbi:MAG: cyclic nucleotide-binding domain-containing protein [Azospirillaceae bacterium]|nr:cyclic nucleotide-binding domain-containing protein [Azospirillaceae bacterium]